MIHLVSLNELILPKFLFLTLLGREVRILRVAPFVPKAKNILQRITDWAVGSGRAGYAVDLAPQLQEYWDFVRRFYFHEVFKKYEPWQNDYYGFQRPEIADDPGYGYGYKQMTCSYTFWKVIEVYLLDAIIKDKGAAACRAHGVLDDTLALGRDRFGAGFAPGVRPMAYPKTVLNAALASLALSYTLTWLIKRVRWSVVQERIAVAFDRMRDIREYELFREIQEAGKLLLVERNPDAPDQPLPTGMDYTRCRRDSGRFTPGGALAGVAMVVTDVLRLARRHWQAPPALLYEMLTLPYKRLLVRGTINRFLPDFFIGRDEYNVDHIMRSLELRAVGVKSIGISNGLFPCFSLLAPNIRYVDFDTYYVYAAPLFDQYRNTWAAHMKIKTMGGYSISRENQLSSLGPRGEDILFTMRVAWNRPEMVPMVRAVAKAFPTRKVLLQFKRGFVSDAETDRLIKACGEGLDNFEHVTDDVYVLLERARYHISDISTFVAESIRSGMVTLLADLLEQEFNCYRLFPGLAIKSAEELVAKLQALESGAETYPHDEYFKLLGCKHGDVGFDLLRDEMGINRQQTAA